MTRDRVAVVTGGARGIGRAFAGALGSTAGTVWLADIEADQAEATAKGLRDEGLDARAISVDVSAERSVRAMVAQVLQDCGRLDLLVNDAAIVPRGAGRLPTEQLSVEEFDRVVAVNLRGTFLCCREVIAPMRSAGGGVIVNVSSDTWLVGSPTRVHYVASKAAVVGLTRSLARELGTAGIRVNAILPGGTLSEDDPDDYTIERRRAAASARAIPRVQVPGDLVGTLLFLVSEDSSFVTGQSFVVDGGAVMH